MIVGLAGLPNSFASVFNYVMDHGLFTEEEYPWEGACSFVNVFNYVMDHGLFTDEEYPWEGACQVTPSKDVFVPVSI